MEKNFKIIATCSHCGHNEENYIYVKGKIDNFQLKKQIEIINDNRYHGTIPFKTYKNVLFLISFY